VGIELYAIIEMALTSGNLSLRGACDEAISSLEYGKREVGNGKRFCAFVRWENRIYPSLIYVVEEK